jgi:hypothetical protein
MSETDTPLTPAQAFADRTFVISHAGGYCSVPEDNWEAVFTELDRRADVLRDIRRMITHNSIHPDAKLLEHVRDILAAAGY